jgi:hypothetical protein
VTLTYDHDLLVHRHVNWLSPVKIRQTLVGGSEKMLVWNDLAPDEQLRIYDSGVTTSPDAEGVYELLVDHWMGDVWLPHIDRYEPLACNGRSLRRLRTCRSSLREGGRAVEFASMPTVKSPVRRRHSSPGLSAG